MGAGNVGKWMHLYFSDYPDSEMANLFSRFPFQLLEMVGAWEDGAMGWSVAAGPGGRAEVTEGVQR